MKVDEAAPLAELRSPCYCKVCIGITTRSTSEVSYQLAESAKLQKAIRKNMKAPGV